jgi:hypothetical protein
VQNEAFERIELECPRCLGKHLHAAATTMGGNKPIEDIEANLLPSAKTALDELVWWAKATIAAKVTEA